MTTWIVKISPDQLDLDAMLAMAPDTMELPVRQIAQAIRKGDQIFVWRGSSGRNMDRLVGIVAEGIVETSPALPTRAAISSHSDEGLMPMADVRIRLVRIRLRSRFEPNWFKNDPIMAGTPLLSSKLETEFLLTEEQSARVNALWRRAKASWTYAETIAGLWAFVQTRGGAISRRPGSAVSIAAMRTGRIVQGMYNKVQHFRSLDGTDAREGLGSNSVLDRDVWARFFDPDRGFLRGDEVEAEFARLWPDAEAEPLPPAPAAEILAAPLTKLDIAHLLARYSNRAQGRSARPRSYRSTKALFDRDPLVVAIALVRAGRSCEVPGCANSLFETSEGEPFVEVHHIEPLADGGDDTPQNVACVCPSHHREAHHGAAASAIRSSLSAIRSRECDVPEQISRSVPSAGTIRPPVP